MNALLTIHVALKQVRFRMMILGAALALLCGCAGIPRQQLDNYVSSVAEANQASQNILADWRSARAESDRRANVQQPAATPIPLVRPAPPGAGRLALSSEDTRALAWEVIAEYTATLARLNAGESVTEVKQTAGRLFDLATRISGSAFPGGGEIVALLQSLVGAIEQARLAAEFKKAVLAGAPILHKIIDQVLLLDIKDHYTLRATISAEDHAAVEVEANLSAEDRRLQQARIEDEFKAFAATLDAYEVLLRQTDASLREMERAVSKPVDFSSEANRLLDITTVLKRQWAAYQNARSEGRK